MILEKISGLNSILYFINKIINLIHIIIPIALILFLTIDLGKAVISQDDESIKKSLKTARNRIIACILIFFLPVIVEILFNNVFSSLNVTGEEYKKIMESYNTVINSEKTNIEDNTKNNDISSKMLYSIESKSDNDKIDIENKYANLSLVITEYLFLNNPIKAISSPIICLNDCKIYYNNKEYGMSNNFYIKYDKKSINGSNLNGEYLISSVKLSNVKIGNDNFSNTLIYYTFKKKNDKYYLEQIKVESKEKIDDYLTSLENNEISKNINSNSKYLSTNKKSYNYSKLNNLTSTAINNIYYKNINSIVMLNTYYDSAVIDRATGFFIANGIIVTSWSYIQNSLMNGQVIVIHDINNNTFECSGVVTFDISKDIAIIKIDKEIKRHVSISDYKSLNEGDPVISIVSKSGYGFTTVAGILQSNDDTITSIIPLSKNDTGSPLFNSAGEVIAMNTNKLYETETSISSPINSLKKIINTLKNQKFKDIKVNTLDELKKQYFYEYTNKEKVNNDIPDKIWSKYKKIGNIENTIILNLIKANYYDKVVSLRYENSINNYISTMSFATNFMVKLEQQGYKKVLDSNKKIMYKKLNNKVIIMEEFNYLIVILAQESII